MNKRNPMQRKDSHSHDTASMTNSSSSAAETEEATTLEKIWQPLFEKGRPTIRLGQFLRGLANHIIDDFEPKGSLVVTPAKMMRFFDETTVADEHYPWETIFGGKISNTSISIMYRKLLCQHHLVQSNDHEAPNIPGLTPTGFETLFTCMIQAHPDTEYERLAKAVQEMPISNADNRSERFPKQLSRRLFPARSHMQAEQRLISSLGHEPELVPPEREASAMPPPPPEPPLQSYVRERERKPYSQHSQHPSALYGDDEEVSPPAVPIERERKPYFAKEGMGKKHDAEGDHGKGHDRDDHGRVYDRESRHQRPDPPTKRPSRSGSGFSAATDPMNIPFANRSHRKSSGPPPAGQGWANSTKKSPTSPNGFARSDSVDVGGISPSQYASNLHGPYFRDPPMHMRESQIRDPQLRDLPMRDASVRESPMRDTQMRDRLDDEDYFDRSNAARNGPQMPTGYDPRVPHRNSVNSMDDRRRSWFTGIPPAGMQPGGPGTDGYGSYTSSNAH